MTRARVVTFHYAALDPAGEVLEQTFGAQPLSCLHGADDIIPELDAALDGREAGEQFELTLPLVEDAELADVQVLPRRSLPADLDVTVGLPLILETRDAKAVLWVHGEDLARGQVHLSSTPPHLARALHLRVEVVAVRPATASEIEQGHAH